MQSRRIGNSTLEVSALGLGCAPMSRTNAARDDDEAIATVHRAVELGVTMLDTSDVYGDGHNEALLGRALAGRRHQITLATKWGSKFLPDRTRGRDGTPANAVRSCEASLQRLGVEVIDLYYLHRIDPKVPLEESIGGMKRLVEAGKVRFIGVSNMTADELRRAHRVHPISALQSEYSLLERELEAEVIPLCRSLGIGIVPYGPLWNGVAGGTYYRSQVVQPGRAEGDPRRWMTSDQRLLEPLARLAEARGATTAQLTLAWLLARGGDIHPIPGTRRRRYLEENVKAADIVLTAAEVAMLDAAYPVGAGKLARRH